MTGKALKRDVVVPSVFRRKSATDRYMIPGASARARAIYPHLHWEKNDSTKPALNWTAFPLDILVVSGKVKPAPQFAVNDANYRRVTNKYFLITGSCVVCDDTYSILDVFLTSADMSSLNTLATQGRIALDEARRDLKPRESFALGGDYSHRDPEMAERRKNAHVERMNGTIWNDGFQTYTVPNKDWGGKYFTQFTRRRPGSDLSLFALPYMGMYAVEQAVVPAIADARRRLHRDANLPSAFPGIPAATMPATQVGISHNFGVRTHADSCDLSITETIFWANRNIANARFAVTSLEIAFDIGTRPCILFQKGNEMHGTVPGARDSCGLVLISKRNTLQQFQRGTYTDRVIL